MSSETIQAGLTDSNQPWGMDSVSEESPFDFDEYGPTMRHPIPHSIESSWIGDGFDKRELIGTGLAPHDVEDNSIDADIPSSQRDKFAAEHEKHMERLLGEDGGDYPWESPEFFENIQRESTRIMEENKRERKYAHPDVSGHVSNGLASDAESIIAHHNIVAAGFVDAFFDATTAYKHAGN